MTFKASNVLKQRVLKAHLSRKSKLKPSNPAG
jgi:integration host factor subunit alpha